MFIENPCANWSDKHVAYKKVNILSLNIFFLGPKIARMVWLNLIDFLKSRLILGCSPVLDLRTRCGRFSNGCRAIPL